MIYALLVFLVSAPVLWAVASFSNSTFGQSRSLLSDISVASLELDVLGDSVKRHVGLDESVELKYPGLLDALTRYDAQVVAGFASFLVSHPNIHPHTARPLGAHSALVRSIIVEDWPLVKAAARMRARRNSRENQPVAVLV